MPVMVALVTNDRALYERVAFDQGHLPLRKGVEIGKRSLLGVNMRMNELTGAFALGQLRKLDHILLLLREKKERFKRAIRSADIQNMAFRRINDEIGECATLLTVQFPEVSLAARVAEALESKTVTHSGWHVYNNMEQFLAYQDSSGSHPYRKNMLPQTDRLLSCSINLSVGVVDPGLGADFGITPLSTPEDIDQKVEEFIRRVKPITG
jgi:8-amino-3,8-dideoxy-alpha-D-manno-octulosonate transaminase